MAPISNQDEYPWRKTDSNDLLDDVNLLYWANPIPRARWELESHREMNSFRYQGSSRPRGARLWCYVCRVRHPDKPNDINPRLAKCMFCVDVYMCLEHRIFLACMGPRSSQTMRCRHSRFTPGLGS
eukprot:2578118-Amphidinium_carterae.1